MELLFLKLLLAFALLIGLPVLMVLLPIIVICAKVNKDRKEREEANALAAESQPAVMVSQEDGRVIAMEASGLLPIMPAAPPPKGGNSIAANAAKQVASRALAAIVYHVIKSLLGRKY